MKRILVISLCLAACSCVIASGCSEVKRTWKGAKEMYFENIEPRPTLDIDAKNLGDVEARRLARLLKPVDERLYTLRRYIDGEDRFPREEWFRTLFERFPWISGVIVVDTTGNVLFQHPVDFSKPVDMEALLALGQEKGGGVEPEAFTPELTNQIPQREETEVDEADSAAGPYAMDAMETEALNEPFEAGFAEMNATDKANKAEEEIVNTPIPESRPWGDHEMRAMSGNSTLGPEIYIAQPFFKNNDWKGLTIIHFDPRNLLEFCPSPEELIILSPSQIIWTSKHQSEAQALAQAPWSEILTSSVYGSRDVGGKEFYWMGRYLDDFHLIYAAAADSPDAQPAADSPDASAPATPVEDPAAQGGK